MAEAPVQPGSAERARPDVLRYPSPTTSRYLILVLALLGAGLFVGNYVHTMVWGDSWTQTVSVCLNSTGGGTPDDLVASSREFSACTAGAEQTRAVVTALGALAVALAALALMWVAPLVVVRRRRLRPLPPGLAGALDRFTTLARDAGVAGRVEPVLGPAAQRDGFSFGAPGRYRVALPPAAAVRWSDASVFDPLVTHELAHVRHRDVALAWLTRLIWWALVPLLAVPVVVGIVEHDYSILGGYVWRVALLAGVVALLSSQLLRSREHDADLRAAQLQHGPGPMLGLVRRLRTVEPSSVGRFLARHPAPEQRAAVLESPALVTRTGFVDGLTGGFLSAAAMPLLVSALTPLLAASGAVVGAYVLSAAVLGPMLAGSVGLGLWRAALVARLGDTADPALTVAAGTGLGLVLGQAVSLQQAGIGSLTGVAQPIWLVITGLAGAGAVVISAGLAQLWADVAPRLPGPRLAWVVALVVNTLLFATLLWACTLFQSSVDLGGWSLARLALLSTLSPWWAVLVVLLLGISAAAGLAMRDPGGRAPAWLVEEGTAVWPTARSLAPRTLLVGLASGACAASVIVAYRMAAGPAADDAATLQRFQAYQWVAVLAAAAVLVSLVLADLVRGAGAALLGAELAVLAVVVGFLALNTGLGGPLDPQLAGELVRPATVLGFYACLLVAPVAALLATALRRPARVAPYVPTAAAVATGLVLALAGAAAALTGRDVLVGPVSDGTVAVEDPLESELPVALWTEVAAYESEVVTEIGTVYENAARRAEQLLVDPTLDDASRSTEFDGEVVAPLRDLLTRMEQLPVGDPDLAAAHDEALHGLELALERYQLVGESGPVLDQESQDRIAEMQEQEARHWQAWSDQRSAVVREVLGD